LAKCCQKYVQMPQALWRQTDKNPPPVVQRRWAESDTRSGGGVIERGTAGGASPLGLEFQTVRQPRTNLLLDPCRW